MAAGSIDAAPSLIIFKIMVPLMKPAWGDDNFVGDAKLTVFSAIDCFEDNQKFTPPIGLSSLMTHMETIMIC